MAPDLSMQNSYTELWKGSEKAVMVVWNHTAYPQTLQKKIPVARAMAVQPVPETPKPGSLQVKMKCALPLKLQRWWLGKNEVGCLMS